PRRGWWARALDVRAILEASVRAPFAHPTKRSDPPALEMTPAQPPLQARVKERLSKRIARLDISPPNRHLAPAMQHAIANRRASRRIRRRAGAGAWDMRMC